MDSVGSFKVLPRVSSMAHIPGGDGVYDPQTMDYRGVNNVSSPRVNCIGQVRQTTLSLVHGIFVAKILQSRAILVQLPARFDDLEVL